MENNFYVYEWFNVETGEVFYVGKGCKKRYLDTQHRNKLFLDYIKSNSVDVRKIYENLTEEEAFQIEAEVTEMYKEKGECKCCLAKGGTGGCSSVWTEEFKEYWSTYNPMKEEKQRERMRQNNPMHNKEIALKNGLKHKRAVIINGVYYDGVIDAAKACGVRDVTISAWCKKGCDSKGNPCRYADEEQKEFSPTITGKAVLIDEKNYYPTVKAAALALGAKDSSPLCRALKANKPYKGHLCRYVNQQPS